MGTVEQSAVQVKLLIFTLCHPPTLKPFLKSRQKNISSGHLNIYANLKIFETVLYGVMSEDFECVGIVGIGKDGLKRGRSWIFHISYKQ